LITAIAALGVCFSRFEHTMEPFLERRKAARTLSRISGGLLEFIHAALGDK